MTVSKKISNNKRVLASINSSSRLYFNDADIELYHVQTNDVLSEWRINTGINQSDFIWIESSRNRPILYEKNVTTMRRTAPTLIFLANFYSYVYLGNLNIVTFYFEWISAGGTGNIQNILFKKDLPALNSLRLVTGFGNTGMSLNTSQNLSYLKNTKYLLLVGFVGWESRLSEYSIFSKVKFLVSRTESNISVLDAGGFPNAEIIQWYFNSTASANPKYVDIAKFFRGTAKLVKIYKQHASVRVYLSYKGGARFPSVIELSESLNFTGFSADGIFYVNAESNIIEPVNPDELSRFLVDFANQVTAVNLPTAQKLIRIAGSSPNTSYTDNSQPKFKTYSAALNHITTTLGVTVQFT
ncbi:hypothetical protein [Soonwooa sp.]|uniref:hypothetical protein n=1 Tax=Soonwooa sp. TaxID=1938592 RepID=UPI0028AE418F|nr:hypothetical protein [Soonwooa sp.]